MDIQSEFGRRVKTLRKRAGLTQARLASRCGRRFEMQRIGEIERGERNCTLRTVESLAKGLKCEPAELLLFRPQAVGKSLSLLDARLLDIWKRADTEKKAKAIRVLSELL